jgi:hypothetical protein
LLGKIHDRIPEPDQKGVKLLQAPATTTEQTPRTPGDARKLTSAGGLLLAVLTDTGVMDQGQCGQDPYRGSCRIDRDRTAADRVCPDVHADTDTHCSHGHY